MIIADTSVWIEYLSVRNPCHSGWEMLLENKSVLAMEIIFAEMLLGARGEKEAATIQELWNLLPNQSEAGLFMKAGWESSRRGWLGKGVGLIDSALVVMARATKSHIWTLDKKLLSILSAEEIFQLA